MPPIITAAMILKPPDAIAAVPNTYAALLNGPPISIAIMPASRHPRRIWLVLPMELRPSDIAVLSAPTNGLIRHMNAPINRTPRSGIIRTGIIFSRLSGRNENTFFSSSTINPPAKPAIRAPINPETAAESPPIFANVHPIVAMYPPTKPTASPGLSAILLAIYPANTGIMKLNAAPPIVLKNAAACV